MLKIADILYTAFIVAVLIVIIIAVKLPSGKDERYLQGYQDGLQVGRRECYQLLLKYSGKQAAENLFCVLSTHLIEMEKK